MKRIIFDVDGVLADFVRGFTSLAGGLFEGIPTTRTHQQPSWYGFPGMTPIQIKQTWGSVDNSPIFWERLAPLVDWQTFQRINLLARQYEVYFCTSRRGLLAKQQTENWLKAFGIIDPTVIVTKRKGEFAKTIGADYAIDDKASNASYIDWQTEGATKSHLLNRPYNLNCPTEFLASGIVRVNSVDEFLEVIR